MDNVLNNPVYSVTTCFAFFGAFLNLIGTGLGQTSRNTNNDWKYNEYGLYWYYSIFYFFFLMTVLASIAMASIHTYRLALLALTTLTLSFMINDMDFSLLKMAISIESTAGSLKFAGLFLAALPIMLLLALFGSEQDSAVHKLDLFLGLRSSDDGDSRENKDKDKVKDLKTFGEPRAAKRSFDPESPRMSGGIFRQSHKSSDRPKSFLPSPMAGLGLGLDFGTAAKMPKTLPSNGNGNGNGNSKDAPPPPPPPPPYPVDRNKSFKAKTLYNYGGSPNDPNEMVFKKGEIMTVLDDRGKWWHVSRIMPDGSVKTGIAPSNYLQPL